MKVFLLLLLILSSVSNLMAAETVDIDLMRSMYRQRCHCKYIDLGPDWDCVPTIYSGAWCVRNCRKIYRHFRDQNLSNYSQNDACRVSQYYDRRNISPWKEYYDSIPWRFEH